MVRKLTAKEQRFVDAYDGVGSDAARAAGYTGTDEAIRTTACRMLKKPHIAAAIQSREKTRATKTIATREQRQEFWTETMNDVAAELRDRLKASELLGKSEGDFIERHEMSGPGWDQLVTASMQPKGGGE